MLPRAIMRRRAVGLCNWLVTRREILSLGSCIGTPRLYKLPLCESGSVSCFHTSVSSTQKDYYKILGVTKDASSKEIREAYVELVKKTHPDRPGTSHSFAPGEDFIGIQEAYEVLNDPKRRSEYDLVHVGYKQQQATKDRYQAKVRNWDRDVSDTFKPRRFHPDSLDTDESYKRTDTAVAGSGDFATVAYIVIALLILSALGFMFF
ncbi:chaperone protein DnaJ-like isoform X1 [Watersipora subatra]|uniref:chaperone protein DnaJ-like isoform X1 n=1 Tax=Watersipora subatra TaxID=2589382 RepID=UPI00355B48F0